MWLQVFTFVLQNRFFLDFPFFIVFFTTHLGRIQKNRYEDFERKIVGNCKSQYEPVSYIRNDTIKRDILLPIIQRTFEPSIGNPFDTQIF